MDELKNRPFYAPYPERLERLSAIQATSAVKDLIKAIGGGASPRGARAQAKSLDATRRGVGLFAPISRRHGAIRPGLAPPARASPPLAGARISASIPDAEPSSSIADDRWR